MARASVTLGVAIIGLALLVSAAAPPPANYDESKVPQYTLPDPLVMQDGTRVTTAEQWTTKRRPELLELFRSQVYGRVPAGLPKISSKVFNLDPKALNGTATRKQVTIYLAGKEDGPSMDLLLYVPNAAAKPAPAFLGLNFGGNQTVYPDPAIRLSTRWMRPAKPGVVQNKASEESRGSARSSWAVEKILARGYALATIYYGDIDPDFHDEFKNGVHGAFDAKDVPRAADAWGSIAAWAWGLGRALDHLATDADIAADRVAVMGHSRLGKTALWAGAEDTRFAVVISNNSGCGGAALSRRAFGETVERINTSFPHWFCTNFKKYNGRENDCPVDQHELIALMAPRPVYVASAEDDRWADPRGEFLSAKGADPVYRLLGKEGLPAEEMPAVNQPVHGTIGYHIRTGKHAVTDYDWEQYLTFADKHMRAKGK
ncbi:acetylxylan esterase [Candidatus Sumerlaeota bacterium]|nr:acetylxylan esterase [Candidatus Sumerlaeota bacterium]